MATIVKGQVDMTGVAVCRPGGFAITDRALNYCGFDKDAKLADIGCGMGATVSYAAEHYGLSICGIEKDSKVLAQAKASQAYSELDCERKLCTAECVAGAHGQTHMLLAGEAEHLPFDDTEMDGLFYECSFSKMENPDKVLTEAARVLKNHGYLVISDFYARGKPAKLSGLLGRLDDRSVLIGHLEMNGFSVQLFEDFSELMKTFWGQMIFDYGCDALYADFHTSKTELAEIKCGYCLIVAKKVK